MSEGPSARDGDNEFRVDIETSNGLAVVVVAGLVDSMALGVLLGAKKRLGAHAGSLDLVISKPDIRRIFEITMLDRVFTLYASRDEALQAGGAASADSVE